MPRWTKTNCTLLCLKRTKAEAREKKMNIIIIYISSFKWILILHFQSWLELIVLFFVVKAAFSVPIKNMCALFYCKLHSTKTTFYQINIIKIYMFVVLNELLFAILNHDEKLCCFLRFKLSMCWTRTCVHSSIVGYTQNPL
jgi:hypothetical protein